MDTIYKIYYIGLAIVALLALWIFYVPHSHSYGVGHTMALNVTTTEDGCRYTWLGGTDYQSFIGDLLVDNVSIGHPAPGAVIYEGTDCNTTVGMYFKDVRVYQTIHPRAVRR